MPGVSPALSHKGNAIRSGVWNTGGVAVGEPGLTDSPRNICRSCRAFVRILANNSSFSEMWLEPGSNRRHADFQSAALPTELSSQSSAAVYGETSTMPEAWEAASQNRKGSGSGRILVGYRSPKAECQAGAQAN